jgi:heterodisulfide reductase subunit A
MPVEGRTYIPIIDDGKCNICAVCKRGCPAEIIPAMRMEESSLRGRIYQDIKPAPSLGAEPVEMPPCQQACPIHQDVRGYIKLITDGEYTEALKLIRETNALPLVTGYVCHHPCDTACVRKFIEDPCAIKNLKRFVADFDDGRIIPPQIKKNGKKISIIGSGPSGLAVAYELARNGYQIEIIEALPGPGGMLRWAIPPFRLPRDILNRDIKYIERMGVVIKTSVKFGVDVTLSGLKKGSDAIIMAIGTHQGLKIGIENERSISGYVDCLAFLRKYSNGEQVALGDKVIVVGGGNAAIDAARSGLRCGAKEVVIIYRRSREEMPADRDEVSEAAAEGVKINYLVAPVRIIEKNGQIQGLECIKTGLGEPDESGRRRPIPIKGSEFVLDATSVIPAIGQQPDLSWNQEGLPFYFSPRNTFIVDDSGSTNMKGVFAIGDAVNGPTTVVEAMASGKKVAESVKDYLSGTERR